MIRFGSIALALSIAAWASCANANITVDVAGEVAHAGGVEFAGAPRLGDVVKAVGVGRNAYILGAAWLRPSLHDKQTRLKAGLLYELGEIQQRALADGNEALASTAIELREWIGDMPVTGRQMVRTLEPHALQVTPEDNFPVANGDRLIYPTRPQSVQVVGAVNRPCVLQHAGLANVRSYLSQCALSANADRDLAYVIEPDGSVSVQGVALWNRSEPKPVAPGAIVLVPLATSAIRHAADATFNREMAEFLATQILGSTGLKP